MSETPRQEKEETPQLHECLPREALVERDRSLALSLQGLDLMRPGPVASLEDHLTFAIMAAMVAGRRQELNALMDHLEESAPPQDAA